jgi:hypothetical protein
MQVYQYYNPKPFEKLVWKGQENQGRHLYQVYIDGKFSREFMVYSPVKFKDNLKKSFLTKKGKALYSQNYFSDNTKIIIGKLSLRWGDTGIRQRPQRWVTLSAHPWKGLHSIISSEHELEIDWQRDEVLRCFNILKMAKLLNISKIKPVK